MSDVTSTTPDPDEPEKEDQPAESKPTTSLDDVGGSMIGEYLSGVGFSIRDMEAYTATSFFGYRPHRRDNPPIIKSVDKFTTPEDKPAEQMYGMQLIKAMSKAEMIEELMHHFRRQCEDLDHEQLIHNIVHARLQSYSQRLHKEARDAGYGSGSIFG